MQSEPSALRHNQAHPDPKRVVAALLNSSFIASKDPNCDFIFSASDPTGSPPPFGLMMLQKKLWFQCPPPLFLTDTGYLEIDRTMSSGEYERASVPSKAAFKLLTYAW
jgi:hypothetical protein